MSPFFHALQQPEYVHTLLNPLPIYGLVLGLITLVVALIRRQAAVQQTALVIIFVTALSVWPVTYFGHAGYDRVLSMSDPAGELWLSAHAHRANQLVWSYYVAAAFATAALILPRFYPKTNIPLLLLVVLLSAGALAAGSYIAYAGGRIRHREFRTELPPPKAPDSDD